MCISETSQHSIYDENIKAQSTTRDSIQKIKIPKVIRILISEEFVEWEGSGKKFGFLLNKERALPIDCIKGMKHLKPILYPSLIEVKYQQVSWTVNINYK